jgi:hypothetical protein
MFVVVLKENPGLPIDSTIWAIYEIIGRMVRIGCAQSLQNYISLIGFIIPVIVPKEEKIRTRGNEHPTIPKFKT